jgi:hypothetical protein
MLLSSRGGITISTNGKWQEIKRIVKPGPPKQIQYVERGRAREKEGEERKRNDDHM